MQGHEPHIADTIIYWMNFSVFVVALYLLTRKAFATAWKTRRGTIIAAINGAQQEYEQAQAQLADSERLYANLENKIDQIKTVLLNEAQKESADIVVAANKASEISIQKANASVESELRVGLKALQRKTLEAAFENATLKIKGSNLAELDSRLIDKTISDANKFSALMN